MGVGGWDSVGEDDVAAYAECGVAAGDGHGVVEGGAGGHEGSRSEGSGEVKFKDGTVDAGGEAEVVRVEDESGRHGVERKSMSEAGCDDAGWAAVWRYGS